MPSKHKQIIKQVAALVRKKFEGEGTGHDWYHIERVWKNARAIAAKEKGADIFVVELAALCHELGDYKMEKDGVERHEQRTAEVLRLCRISPDIIRNVTDITTRMSFSKSFRKKTSLSLEGKIVQDADRLEAMGAIGIARAFAFGGAKGRMIYNPKDKPRQYQSQQAYKNNTTATINHFYEKLLLLKDRMNTKTAKKIAAGRHKVMENFLKQFYAEWDGKR